MQIIKRHAVIPRVKFALKKTGSWLIYASQFSRVQRFLYINNDWIVYIPIQTKRSKRLTFLWYLIKNHGNTNILCFLARICSNILFFIISRAYSIVNCNIYVIIIYMYLSIIYIYLENGLFFMSSNAIFAFSTFRQARSTLAPEQCVHIKILLFCSYLYIVCIFIYNYKIRFRSDATLLIYWQHMSSYFFLWHTKCFLLSYKSKSDLIVCHA